MDISLLADEVFTAWQEAETRHGNNFDDHWIEVANALGIAYHFIRKAVIEGEKVQ